MSEFTTYLQELFTDFGPVRIRKMFGGYGIFHQGIMFALVADDTLYLKGDKSSAADFKSRGLPQFEYPRNNKMIKMSYYMAPAETLEDSAEMAVWARRAFKIAGGR